MEEHFQTYPLISSQVIVFLYATCSLALVSALVRSERMVVGGVGLVDEEEGPPSKLICLVLRQRRHNNQP